MKHLRLAVALMLLSFTAPLHAQTRLALTQNITVSGTSQPFPNSNGALHVSFEELIAGSPATVSIVIQGCQVGNTCETVDTYTTVANAIRSPSLTKVYDSFLVTASWTGGTNVAVTINATLSTANGGTATSGGSVTAVSTGNLPPLFTATVTNPTSTPGLSFSLSNAAANFVFGNCTGSLTTPNFCALTGAMLPNPSSTTLGGIESFASQAHKWINAISNSGVPSATQPASTDLSDYASLFIPTVSSPQNTQTIVYNGSAWVNGYGGVSVDPQTGDYTFSCPTDRLGEIEFDLSAAHGFYLPQAGSTTCTGSNMGMVVRNDSISTAALTLCSGTGTNGSCTAGASSFKPENVSSLTIIPGGAAFVYSDNTNYHAVPIPTAPGGVNTQTASYTATTLDKDKMLVMNCSSACALTLPAAPPTSKWHIWVLSIGSTLATVNLNSLNFNGAGTAPTLTTGHSIHVRTDGSNYFGDISASAAGVSSGTQGEPYVNTNSSTGNATSPVYIDATQKSGADLCAQIHAAIVAFPNSVIDARGFSNSSYVCSAANATTMLFATTAGGSTGRLLLGNYTIYIDGPSSGNFNDGNSGAGGQIGTPAIEIPENFGGIFGLQAYGQSIISHCTGLNTPVAGCNNQMPIRSMAVSTATVAGTNMTVKFTSATLTNGTNIFVNSAGHEYVMLDGNTTAVGGNNMFRIQSETDGAPGTGSIVVKVPSSTASCSSSCGTAYFETPLLGFGPAQSNGVNPYNVAGSGGPANSANTFGSKVDHVQTDCLGAQGCGGIQNLYDEELSGNTADTVRIKNVQFVGLDVHGNQSQNSGPYVNLAIGGALGCSYGTTGVILADSSTRGLRDSTVTTYLSNSNQCTNTPVQCVIIDNNHANKIGNVHVEGCTNGYAVGAGGAVNGLELDTGSGPPSVGVSFAHIFNYFATSHVQISGLWANAATNTLQDDINSNTITDSVLGFYAFDKNAGLTGLLSTGLVQNLFAVGLTAPVVNVTNTVTEPSVNLCPDTSGSGSAQVCNTSPTFTVTNGSCITYTTTTANTGSSLTLNVNSLGAKSVAKWQGTTALVANDVLANKQVQACYDGTNWELGTIGNSPGGINFNGLLNPNGAATYDFASSCPGGAGCYALLQNFNNTGTQNAFTISTKSTNTSTGSALDVQTNDTSSPPFTATANGTANGVQVGTNGTLAAIGTGKILSSPYTTIPSSDTISSCASPPCSFATTITDSWHTYLQAGSVLEIHLHGVYSTTATASPIFDIAVTAGGTTNACAPSSTAYPLSVSQTNGGWDATCYIQILTTGSSGTAVSYGPIAVYKPAPGGGGNVAGSFAPYATNFTFNTSVAENISFQLTTTALVSGESFTLQSPWVSVRP
jgi:hypothetical protein